MDDIGRNVLYWNVLLLLLLLLFCVMQVYPSSDLLIFHYLLLLIFTITYLIIDFIRLYYIKDWQVRATWSFHAVLIYTVMQIE